MFVIINRVKGSWNISLCLPACLVLLNERRQTQREQSMRYHGKDMPPPRPPNPTPTWWADQIERPLSPAVLWSQNCFKRPQRGAGCCATANAFIFLMATRVMLFAQKKKPYDLAACVACRCQGPRPVSEVCGHRLPADQTIEQGQF